MPEEEKGKKLKDIMYEIREKITKKGKKPLKLIKLSSRPEIKFNINKA